MEPEEVEPGDGINHVSDARLTSLGVEQHAVHIITVVRPDSGMPLKQGITVVDDLYLGWRAHGPWIRGQGLPVLDDFRV